MNKKLNTLEVVNIVSYVNNVMTEEQINAIPTKVKWYLKKNMDKIRPTAKKFEDFRADEVAILQKEFFTDEKSTEYTETQKDGNGVEHEVPMRKVKDEYMDDYKEAVNKLNVKLQEILDEENEFNLSTIDFDAFVESLPDDSPIDFDCLNILSFMEEAE